MEESRAIEYTPELSKSYLSSLMGDIDDQGRADEGRRMAEMTARGLSGQVEADAAVDSVRTGVRREKSRAIGEFNLNVANMRRDERLGERSRGWNVEDRDYAAAESAKTRAFQREMTQLGFQYGDASARRDKIDGQQGAVMGAGLKLAGGAANMGLAAMMGSDRRLKKNIVAVGKDGPLTVYEFDYLSEEHPELDLPEGRMVGFMADDVEAHFPEAVAVIGGFKHVAEPFHPRAA